MAVKKERIINTVASERANLNMTQQELASEVGVTRQTIIAIEKGDYTPSVTLAIKLAGQFKKPVEKLFSIEYA